MLNFVICDVYYESNFLGQKINTLILSGSDIVMPHPGPPDYLYTMNIVSINKEAYSLSYDNTTTMHIGKYVNRKQNVVTQVQGELHIARKEVCYFVVWSPTEFHYQVRVQNVDQRVKL